jgi:hypothetical protein
MEPVLSIESYLNARERPAGQAWMRMRWRDLLFAHAAVEPEFIQERLPAGLMVDTWPDETGRPMAWLGWVPFRMEEIRLAPFKCVMNHRFLETNLRTYVHDGRRPGVWFFHLDANHRLAVWAARTVYGLPYSLAKLDWDPLPNQVEYRGAEPRPYEACIERPLGLDRLPPGTVEFFWLERYWLFSQLRGRLRAARIWHAPYRVGVPRVSVQPGIFAPLGFPSLLPTHFHFAADVRVRVYPLE